MNVIKCYTIDLGTVEVIIRCKSEDAARILADLLARDVSTDHVYYSEVEAA